MKKFVIALLAAAMLVVLMFVSGCSADSKLVSEENPLAQITSEDVLKIEADMTYKEIFTMLGATQGSEGTAQYLVDGIKHLNIGYGSLDEKSPYSGAEYLEFTVAAIGIRGEVTNLTEGNGNIIMLVEGAVEEDTMYDKANVTMTADTKVFDEGGNAADITDVAAGDTVEVIFDGAVAESYPVQGRASIVRIIE